MGGMQPFADLSTNVRNADGAVPKLRSPLTLTVKELKNR